MDQAPAPIAAWIAQLPSQNVGTLYATIEWFGIRTEHRVPVWGQVCDGEPHTRAVYDMLHNEWPFQGKGAKYVAWRCVPDNPDANKYPRGGVIENPVAYDGK